MHPRPGRPLRSTLRRWLAVAVLAVGLTARAQVLAEHDFEAPGSDAVPAWTSVSVTAPDMTFTRAERSAAVGDAGLFLQRPPGGSTGAVQLYRDVDARWRGTVYAHAWVRLGPASEPGQVIPLQLLAQAIGSAAEFAIVPLPDGGLDFGVNASFMPAGAWTPCVARVPFTTDTWHLAEVSAVGMGTDAGRLAGALDGREICAMRTNWAGSRFLEYRFGHLNGGATTAAIDLDALRLSTVPMASHLQLATVTDGGACVEVWARASATFDAGVVERDYPSAWSVEHDGGARLAACADQAGVQPTVEAGEWGLVARVAPQGEPTLVLSAPDLVPARVTLVGPPWDAGVEAADAGPAAQSLKVGCDCSSGLAQAPLALLLTLGALARRRRRA